MPPDYRARRRQTSRSAPPPDIPDGVRLQRSPDDAHEIVYFQRHADDDPARAAPGWEFHRACPVLVRTKLQVRLAAVAAAPPHRFAGGGYWEAMHGEMAGWFECRADGPGRVHYRLFCVIDTEAKFWDKPLLTVIAGLSKPFRSVLTARDYQQVRRLGDEYWSRNPRSLKQPG